MNEVRISYIDKSFFIAVLFNLEKACASVLKSGVTLFQSVD